MRVVLKTKVPGNIHEVMERFDIQLFEALKPPLAKIEIKKFTGSKTGDQVHIVFISPIKAEWISDIIDHGSDQTKAWFVDKGIKLPFPLAFWEHHHIVEKIDAFSVNIVDDMRFKGVNNFWTKVLYPLIYISFYPRKFIYRRYFSTK